MTTSQLKKLKENELKKFSYPKTKEVVDALENLNLHDIISGFAAHEEIEKYISFAATINNRVDNNEFPYLNLKINQKEKVTLQNRLLNILANLRHLYNFVRLSGRDDEIEQVGLTLQELQLEFAKLQCDYNEKKKNVDNIIGDYEKKIKDSESHLTSHVLSIMGVFSAIITIILSIIITSSSWLNNADGASAIIAFVVPNIVALFVVFVLLSLIFFYLHKDTNEQGEKCAKQKRSSAFTFAIIGTLVSAGLCCWLCISSSPKTATHIRYIIPSTQYRIVEDTVDAPGDCHHDSESNCNKVRCIEFTFEGNNYSFEYDESLKHGENLYFCEKHCTLE